MAAEKNTHNSAGKHAINVRLDAKGAQSAVLPQYEANTAATQEGSENRSQTKNRVDLKHADIGRSAAASNTAPIQGDRASKNTRGTDRTRGNRRRFQRDTTLSARLHAIDDCSADPFPNRATKHTASCAKLGASRRYPARHDTISGRGVIGRFVRGSPIDRGLCCMSNLSIHGW
jgi:hypothetical protein